MWRPRLVSNVSNHVCCPCKVNTMAKVRAECGAVKKKQKRSHTHSQSLLLLNMFVVQLIRLREAEVSSIIISSMDEYKIEAFSSP